MVSKSGVAILLAVTMAGGAARAQPYLYGQYDPAWSTVVPAVGAVVQQLRAGVDADLRQVIAAQQALPPNVPRPIRCFELLVEARSRISPERPDGQAQAGLVADQAMDCYTGKRLVADTPRPYAGSPASRAACLNLPYDLTKWINLVNAYWKSLIPIYYAPPVVQDLDPSSEIYYNPDKNILLYNPMYTERLYLQAGAMGVIVVIAHEIGHHVQYLEDYQFRFPQWRELDADRLAGAFLGWAAAKGYIGSCDIEKAVLQAAIDSDELGLLNAESHGTAEQRTERVMFGYQHGPHLPARLTNPQGQPRPATIHGDVHAPSVRR